MPNDSEYRAAYRQARRQVFRYVEPEKPKLVKPWSVKNKRWRERNKAKERARFERWKQGKTQAEIRERSNRMHRRISKAWREFGAAADVMAIQSPRSATE